ANHDANQDWTDPEGQRGARTDLWEGRPSSHRHPPRCSRKLQGWGWRDSGAWRVAVTHGDPRHGIWVGEAANTAGTTTQERPLCILRRSVRASQIWWRAGVPTVVNRCTAL